MISNGVTPTVFYWLEMGIYKILNPRNLDKKYLNKFKTIILIRYIPFNIFIDLIFLKRKSKKIILLLDDNLLDLNIFSEIPFLYKLKIFINIYCYKYFFNFFLNEIWVTNKSLAEKVQQKISKSNINAFNFINKWPNWEKKILNISGEKFSGKSHLANIFRSKSKAFYKCKIS